MEFQSAKLEKLVHENLKNKTRGYWKQSLACKFFNEFKWNTMAEIWKAIKFYIADYFFCQSVKMCPETPFGFYTTGLENEYGQVRGKYYGD